VVGAQVDDFAVLTTQCNAQQLFLAMTGSRKRKDYTGFTSSLFFVIFCFTPNQHSKGDRGE
jgi:hypothetical protein